VADPLEAVDSVSQDDYIALAEAIRGRLKQMALANLPTWPPESVKWLLDACQAVYWFEVNARAFDARARQANSCLGD